MSRLGVFLAMTLTLLSLASLASAQPVESDDEQARSHFLAARSYYEQARYEDAAREFEEAYRLSSRAALLVNLSMAYERSGDLPHAADALERYLAEAQDIDNRVSLESRLTALRARIAAGEIGTPDPTTSPDDGAAPPPATDANAESGGGMSGLMIGSIASFGVAAASVIVLAVTGAMADDRFAQLASMCPGAECDSSLRPVRDEGVTLATVSTAFTFVAIGTAVLGGVLLVLGLLDGGSPDRGGQDHVRLRLTPNGVALTF